MGKVAGIDFGDRRIGIAMSDWNCSMAFPRETIEWKGKLSEAVRRVLDSIREDVPSIIVVGSPLEMDGKRGKQADRVGSFVDLLRQGLDWEAEVEELDERLTSKQAERLLGEAGMSTRAMKGRVDQAAAALILQSYLDRQFAVK